MVFRPELENEAQNGPNIVKNLICLSKSNFYDSIETFNEFFVYLYCNFAFFGGLMASLALLGDAWDSLGLSR